MSKEDLNLIPNTDYCIQQYLGDEKQEYTVACYVDKKGTQQELIIMRRDLKYGTTVFAEIVDNLTIREECMKICNMLNPTGPLNIQLRMHNGIPICFELNVRFSGTASIRAKFGYNDVDAMIREYIFNEEIDTLLKPLNKGKAYRYYNEFYIDTDMFETLNDKKEVKNVNLFKNSQECKK
jgi:carbamoyl-phosphate synthase large subunit